MSPATAVGAIAALRMSLGIGTIVAPARTARLFGYPREQLTPMTILVARWFGVREVVLALLALRGHGGATPVGACRSEDLDLRRHEFAALNAINDAADAVAMLVPLARRQGIARPQLIGIPVALAVTAGWMRVLRGHSRT